MILHRDRVLRAIMMRLTWGRWGVGVDLYACGLSLWTFTPQHERSADFGRVGGY